jgi:hypothetical protein
MGIFSWLKDNPKENILIRITLNNPLEFNQQKIKEHLTDKLAKFCSRYFKDIFFLLKGDNGILTGFNITLWDSDFYINQTAGTKQTNLTSRYHKFLQPLYSFLVNDLKLGKVSAIVEKIDCSRAEYEKKIGVR